MFNFSNFEDFPSISDFKVVNQATDSRDPMELDLLSRHKDPNVRARVAENMHTPIEVLERLAKDEAYVRTYLVRNRILPYRLLKQMAADVEKLPKLLVFQIYERLLASYKEGRAELDGGELHTILKVLAPDKSALEVIELMETIYTIRDKQTGKTT